MQEKRGRRARQLNNKGLTLVEVIISVCILTVVVVATTNVLIMTAKYNAKANESQHTILAAESIMEAFKAYEVNDLMYQFANNSFVGCESWAGGTYVDNGSNKYTFTIDDMVADGFTYDAVISLEPYTLATQTTYDLTVINDLNPYRDAMLRYSTEYYYATGTKVEEQIKDHFDSTVKTLLAAKLNTLDQQLTYTEADILDDYINVSRRNSYISIDKGTSNTTATLTMKYYYNVKNYPYHDDATPGSPANGRLTYPMDGSSYCIDIMVDIPNTLPSLKFYENPHLASGESRLERVFIYYYPAYGMQEQINISTTGITTPIECYLLKQLPPSGVMSNDVVKNYEGSYSPDINGNSMLKLRHNYEENIADEGGTHATVNLGSGGFAEIKEYMDESLVEKKNLSVLYNITVEVKDSSGMTTLVSLSGTKNE